MQTFLPYPDFERSAQVLDRQRLGKQRVEGFQILKSLLLGGGWQHHPATKQWTAHEDSLCEYITAMCNEWTDRGYQDSIVVKVRDLLAEYPLRISTSPWWLGYAPYHSSHRANLLRKNPEYYGQFGWTENPSDPYYWPSHNSNV